MKIRMTWELPVTEKTYREIGKTIHALALFAKKLTLEYADVEGMVFDVKFYDESTLSSILDLARQFEHVKVEVEDNG